ncbi:tRNA-uridine aminocarboxypropyltransferase [Pulveribacter suum]|uniref:tRNA-uridine aminocarboxypropyltransferase n=1 Tax=Pulveribacter suum TaxID=2116657 RepID=A0A2P1NH95_9BURK|nr:DTW domain-containing protein [Pulveribacter suum]AVP56415.1 DTW domain-containing protein [Pulveribacter suum]
MTQKPPAAPHAVARLRDARLARSAKPFLARGGSRRAHCAGCRLVVTHCTCALRPQRATQAGVCLLMHDIEPLKPSNTGWLIADVVADTWAFGWSRTEADPALLALLQDARWQPFIVFPAEGLAPGRAVVQAAAADVPALPVPPGRRPLFVLLDATWAEARKMFRKSPYLERFPVLALQGDAPSRYRLRHAPQGGQWCTSEVAARCLELAGDAHAAAVLHTWLDVFGERYEQARQQRPAQPASAAHQQLAALAAASLTPTTP